MMTFDGDYSLTIHMEIDEGKALEQGGVSIEQTKKNIDELTDWLLAAIAANIELGENDVVAVIPYKRSLKVKGEEIELENQEDYEQNTTFMNLDDDEHVVVRTALDVMNDNID